MADAPSRVEGAEGDLRAVGVSARGREARSAEWTRSTASTCRRTYVVQRDAPAAYQMRDRPMGSVLAAHIAGTCASSNPQEQAADEPSRSEGAEGGLGAVGEVGTWP
jgi:hypothetical protein